MSWKYGESMMRAIIVCTKNSLKSVKNHSALPKSGNENAT